MLDCLKPSSSAVDRALIRRYVAGDEDAARLLHSRYRPGLYRYLLRRLGCHELAEESVQETFLRFFARAPDLLEHPRPAAWLFSVARNVSVDVRRRRRLQAATFSELEKTDVAVRPAAEDERPEERMRSRELNRLLMDAVRALPALEREVFFLRTQAMLPFREVAEAVGAPLNTVLSRMHRAVKRIRRAMAVR